ncbi:hypothetical protein FNV43_RR22916 [Rhamnella rubrinervis]|uniref:Small auxin-up RNA n=1 Tax=Rhamnella rubrinervis TaxID=2594499 RepID=A0A8K0DX22_9ROSA|nr:hypothetical protein FNV43_RR22916 [Rhamnella rubrinervis]
MDDAESLSDKVLSSEGHGFVRDHMGLQREYITIVFRFTEIDKSRKNLLKSRSTWNQSALKGSDIPKGYIAVYVGECQKKRFVIPISSLKEPPFQELLSQAGEEFHHDYPMGCVTISCHEDVFFNLISRFNV